MSTHINRPDLLALLDKGLDLPLILIVAPAGSGKSVLLEQWKTHQQSSPSECQLLHFQMTPKFNEGHTLFALIFEALKSVAPLWDAPFFNLFKDDSEVKAEQIIEVFIDAFKQVDHPIAMTFDDFHLIKSNQIHRILEILISHLPPNITIALSSRNHPQFSIAKLKLQESVLLIDSHDLRLDESSLQALNQSINGSSIQTERAYKLLEQTEGWFVGTKLALLAYEKTGDTALDNFSGSQPELLNYFGHEVLNKLKPSLRRFVIGTSICQAFNQELCERILNIDYSAAKLEEIAMQELFLSPVPGVEGWYRYHPLLQDFLVKRLEIEEGADYIKERHYMIAEYFLEQNDLNKAIYHASRSTEKHYYLKILKNACQNWVRQGELEAVIDNLSELSHEDFVEHPNLLISQLFALLFTRRFNQAHFYLEQLAKANLDDSDLKNHFHFFELLLTMFQSDTEVLTPHPKAIPADLDAPEEALTFLKIVEAYSLMCNGNLSKAFKLANEAKQRLRQIGHSFFESFANLVIILCDRYLGRGLEALQLMNEVFLPIKNNAKTPLWANLATGMLVVEYEQNRLKQSLDLSAQLTPLLNHSCATEQVATVYLYSSRLFHLEGKISKASRLLDQLERILSLGDYQRLNSQLVHEKMRQALANNDLSTCEHIYEHYHLFELLDQGVWKKSERYEEARERHALAAVYYLLSKGRYERAGTLLEEIAQMLVRHSLVSRALVARCNIAMIAFKLGKTDHAISQLKRLISRYGLVCFSRSVFDEAPGLEQLFRLALRDSKIKLPYIFTNIFSTLLEEQSEANQLVQPSHILTDKELEIFELLAAGLSNQEISTQSNIAISTTKWHLKNIYAKLGVKNRSAALALAHRTQAA